MKKKYCTLFLCLFLLFSIGCKKNNSSHVKSISIDDQSVYIGETMDLTKVSVGVIYENGDTKSLTLADDSLVITNKPDYTKEGSYVVNVALGTVSTNFTVWVIKKVTGFKLTVSLVGEGSVVGDGYYEAGTEVTLTATPSDGYDFISWNRGEIAVSKAIAWKFTMPENNLSVTCIFKATPTSCINVVNRTLFAAQNLLNQKTANADTFQVTCDVSYTKTIQNVTTRYSGTLSANLSKIDTTSHIQVELWNVETLVRTQPPDYGIYYQDGAKPSLMVVKGSETTMKNTTSIQPFLEKLVTTKNKTLQELLLTGVTDQTIIDSLNTMIDRLLGENQVMNIFTDPLSGKLSSGFSINLKELLVDIPLLVDFIPDDKLTQSQKNFISWLQSNANDLPDIRVINSVNYITEKEQEVIKDLLVELKISDDYIGKDPNGNELKLFEGNYNLEFNNIVIEAIV